MVKLIATRRRQMTIHAIYENGVFRPLEPVELPDKTEVQISVHVNEAML